MAALLKAKWSAFRKAKPALRRSLTRPWALTAAFRNKYTAAHVIAPEDFHRISAGIKNAESSCEKITDLMVGGEVIEELGTERAPYRSPTRGEFRAT